MAVLTTIIDSVTDVSRIRQGVAAVGAQLTRSGGIMMMIGPFIFARDTAPISSGRRNTPYTWPALARVGRPPALQYTGQGVETWQVDGVIYPQDTGQLTQMPLVRELAGLGQPLPVVDGRGIVYGNWVITQVEETMTVFWPNGVARKIAFRVSLSRYVADDNDSVIRGAATALLDGGDG